MQKINQELEGERWHNDPDFAQGQEEFMVETFNQADHESKGYLTQEEFREFYTAIQADGGKRGIYEDPRESKIERAYELANRINEERDGVSFEEWIMLCYAQVAKTQELKNTDKARATKASLPLPTGPNLPQELQAQIDDYARDCYINWRDNSTPKQK